MSPLQIELFSAPNCSRCGKAQVVLQRIARSWPEGTLRWRVVDVVAELDHAVAMGVLATPAIAIDGTLVFTALPGEGPLKETLRRRIEGQG